MKLVTWMKDGESRLAIRTDRGLIDLIEAQKGFPSPKGSALPKDIMEVIGKGDEAVSELAAYVEALLASGEMNAQILLDESVIDYAPCVTRPNKMICVGLNYRKHAEETNAAIPVFPILFNKFANTLTGHGHDVPLPKVSDKVDYEAELAIVIGKKAKYVAKEDALNHVFGYCNVNDLSARDLQLRTQQWMLGKCLDSFSPLGPYLVTADEIANPNDLTIKCIVNGEVRQNSNTSDMIFHCDEIVSYISQHMTLEPGDVILTGTPEGVVLGYPEDKQVYLKPGDVVTIEIEGLGSITNRMVEEVQ
ncbi:fumarylacetoacetate hydrolase family protein [Cohnella herbarum]|uniref:Fumarylacetoacetate hydrolase family protein n=1 Tax=Cohnella herbarum TaxID=2728023 RepID=A0A7Z2VFI3_9BACL|nr:fumarylacetoacetate hydrolase family protein [Cohnella herbarum]QJD82111.1 fumarylacetoacetate hydrolase family protein [Cohnella herbarum]